MNFYIKDVACVVGELGSRICTDFVADLHGFFSGGNF